MIPSSYHKENESHHTSINNDDNNHFGNNPISSSSGEAYRINSSSYSPANRKLQNQIDNNRELLKSEILVDSYENNGKISKLNSNNNIKTKYDDQYTTSILIEAKNSLNSLRNDSNKLDKNLNNNKGNFYAEEENDDFYFDDDDDTKVIIVKSLSSK
jgi:hypothetical protein